MKDIEKILEIATAQEIQVPPNIHYRIQYVLKNKNKKTWKMSLRKLIQIVATTFATIVTTTGMVWAGSHIYNEYIKKQGSINSNGLLIDENNIYNREIIEGMSHDEHKRMYYKIITNNEEYDKYKNNVNELPEMTLQDFNDNFLVIVTWDGKMQEHEKDLRISAVTTDETTTYITLRQSDNPDYNNKNNILYAIVGKEQLRDNIKVELDKKEVTSPRFANVEDLPEDYSVQDAISDGCLVVENLMLKSPDLSIIDNFIANTEAGEEEFVRIYQKYDYSNIQTVQITDIRYLKGIYYMCSYDSNDATCTPIYHSSKTFQKLDFGKQIRYCYDVKIKDNGYSGFPIVYIKK